MGKPRGAEEAYPAVSPPSIRGGPRSLALHPLVHVAGETVDQKAPRFVGASDRRRRPGREVRDLGSPMGVLCPDGTLYSRCATILLPSSSIVECVSVHELIHPIGSNHAPGVPVTSRTSDVQRRTAQVMVERTTERST